MAFKRITPRERLAHYEGIANGTIPTDPNSKYTKKEQIAYARAQVQARKENNVNYMLGKNSPLSEKEKGALKEKLRAKNREYRKELANKKDTSKKKK